MITLKLTKSPVDTTYEDQMGFSYTKEEVSELIASGDALIMDVKPVELIKYDFNAIEEAFVEYI